MNPSRIATFGLAVSSSATTTTILRCAALVVRGAGAFVAPSRRRASTRSDDDDDRLDGDDVPLVFVPGLKGSHLSRRVVDRFGRERTERVWLTLSNLLNLPPRAPDDPRVDLTLRGEEEHDELFPDGVIGHIVESPTVSLSLLGGGGGGDDDNASLRLSGPNLLPFYGHVVDRLRRGARPWSIFDYDWRQSLPTVAARLREHCVRAHGDRPVQLLAHSMGGLAAYACCRRDPERHAPGAVLVGVPFGTGVQYLRDLNEGYRTELGTCEQFPPETLFSFDSHWSFFPGRDETGDSFVEMLDDDPSSGFDADASSAIGAPAARTRSRGAYADRCVPVAIDFYDAKDWERHELGVFAPRLRNDETTDRVARSLSRRLDEAAEWRRELRAVPTTTADPPPPLTICASDAVPTRNQIARRRRRRAGAATDDADAENTWEYDYVSGRAVPGDGRVDYDKAFPYWLPKDRDGNDLYEKVPLRSLHAKQMCWEKSGGDLETISEKVDEQLSAYVRSVGEERRPRAGVPATSRRRARTRETS